MLKGSAEEHTIGSNKSWSHIKGGSHFKTIKLRLTEADKLYRGTRDNRSPWKRLDRRIPAALLTVLISPNSQPLNTVIKKDLILRPKPTLSNDLLNRTSKFTFN